LHLKSSVLRIQAWILFLRFWMCSFFQCACS
jgi:hypothetical protein